jgi:hypothetical protein
LDSNETFVDCGGQSENWNSQRRLDDLSNSKQDKLAVEFWSRLEIEQHHAAWNHVVR